jgi:glycosyltransferase involved in cell wall biosynthesis
MLEGAVGKMKKIVVIIPAYDEEKTIVQAITAVPAMDAKKFEVVRVVIDDGSKDATAELARSAGAVVLTHTRNMGMGASIKTGLQYALEQGADIAVSIDADLQFDPAEIPLLIQPILDGKADFVAGDRFTAQDGTVNRPDYMSGVKFWGNQRMTSLINSLTGSDLKDVSSGFRAYTREAILNLNLTGKYTISHETIMDLAFKQMKLVSVPVSIRYYPDRKSKVAGNLFQYLSQAFRIITRAYRDYKPLKFFFYLGMPPMLVGLAGLIFLLIHWIVSGDFTPYKFVGFTGIYLVSLGLLLWILGFLSDILVGIRMTQERILYYQKKNFYMPENGEDQRSLDRRK